MRKSHVKPPYSYGRGGHNQEDELQFRNFLSPTDFWESLAAVGSNSRTMNIVGR